MDVSRINGYPVQGLDAAEGPGADKAKRAAANLEVWAKANPDVNQILGPNGCWERNENRKWEQLKPGDPRNDGLIRGHTDHYHINVYRK